MRQLSKIPALLAASTMLMVGAVAADPDRESSRGKTHDQSPRACSQKGNCGSLGQNDRQQDERGNGRRNDPDQDNDRDIDRRYSDDNYRSRWDRDYNGRNRSRFEFRISTYPYYNEYRRRPYYYYNRPRYDYYPPDYYYRKYGSAGFPDRSYDSDQNRDRIIWNDEPQSNVVNPMQTNQQFSDQYCREYYRDVIINGQPQQVFGTACRQEDGTWKIKN